MGGRTRTRLASVDDYVALDTETTGLLINTEIIEVAAVKVEGGKEVESYSSLVKPTIATLPSEIVEKTKITDDMLADAPSPNDVMQELSRFVGDSVIVGHNICFDIDRIGTYTEGLSDNELVDTYRLSKILVSGVNNRQLGTIFEWAKRKTGISTDFGDGHRALSDARMAWFCYEALKPLLIEAYGDNPEESYNRAHKSSGTHSEKPSPEGLVPQCDPDPSNPFYGSSVCITGTIDGMERKIAWQKLVNLGADIHESVKKTTDVLIVGDLGKRGVTSKLEKAQKRSMDGALEIIPQEQFLKYAMSV